MPERCLGVGLLRRPWRLNIQVTGFRSGGKGEARTALPDGAEASTTKPTIRASGADAKQTVRAQSSEPPYTDPCVRWCGRGGLRLSRLLVLICEHWVS